MSDPATVSLARQARAAGEGVLAEARRAFQSDAHALCEALFAGEIDPLRFQMEMRALVKDLHVTAFVAGRGMDWTDVTRQDWGRVGQVLRTQYGFLSGWTAELFDLSATSLAKMKARATQYGAAASQTFEIGNLISLGVNPGILPDMPGSTGTLCGANCYCRWSVLVISKRRGDFNVSWRLGAAEHCRTCRRRARAWKQIRIRGGRIVSSYEPVYR